MTTPLKCWSFAQKTERPKKKPSSLLLMRNVNKKKDLKKLGPLKCSDNLLTFSRVSEGNVVPKTKFFRKNFYKRN